MSGLPIPSRPYRALLERFRTLSVVVIGDVCLDRYVFGRATRLSREAPIAVLEWSREYCLPGEASNPALNVAALGAAAYVVGVTGADAAGFELRSLLGERGIGTEGLLSDAARRTTEKTRILAEGLLVLPQQLTRLDRTDAMPLAPEQAAALCSRIRALAPSADALLLSDYKHGVVDPAVDDCVRELSGELGTPSTVDSQGDLYRFRGLGIVRSNRADAEAVLGRPLRSEEDFERELPGLRRELACDGVVVTRDVEGLSYYAEACGYGHVPGAVVPVADVVGAGDTVIAVLTLALAAGEELPLAAHAANAAASLVVQHVGNAAPSPERLLEALEGSGRG